MPYLRVAGPGAPAPPCGGALGAELPEYVADGAGASDCWSRRPAPHARRSGLRRKSAWTAIALSAGRTRTESAFPSARDCIAASRHLHGRCPGAVRPIHVAERPCARGGRPRGLGDQLIRAEAGLAIADTLMVVRLIRDAGALAFAVMGDCHRMP